MALFPCSSLGCRVPATSRRSSNSSPALPGNGPCRVNPCSSPRSSLMYHSVSWPRTSSTRSPATRRRAASGRRRSPARPMPVSCRPQLQSGPVAVRGVTRTPSGVKLRRKLCARFGARTVCTAPSAPASGKTFGRYSSPRISAWAWAHQSAGTPSAGRFGAGRAQAPPASRKTAASSNAAIVPIFCCFALFTATSLLACVKVPGQGRHRHPAGGELWRGNGCATSILTVFPGCPVARLPGCPVARLPGRTGSIARGRMEVPGRRWGDGGGCGHKHGLPDGDSL